MSEVTSRRKEFKAADGRTLWRVDVERTYRCQIFVLADTEVEAEEDGRNLAVDIALNAEWEDIEDQAYAYRSSVEPAPDEYVWTGGPKGRDEFWGNLIAKAEGQEGDA